MCKRILTVVTTLVAIALTLCVLMHVVAEASAAEASAAEVINEIVVEETQPSTVKTAEEQENNYDIIEYVGQQYKIPHLSLNREPGVTESGYVEQYTEVPHFFQSYYPHVRYGDSNISKSGCGIACVSMVFTYLLDKEVTIEELAEKYCRYKVKGGSTYNLFPDSAEDYGVTIEKQVWNWDEAKEALENGHVIIARADSQSVFTTGGHFIVLSGLTEEGRILVRDPNLFNYSIWNYPVREDGYANGFEEKTIKNNCFPMWVYQLKDLDAVAERVEAEKLNLEPTDIETNP